MTPRQQARAAVHCEVLAATTLHNGDMEGAAVLYEAAARIHEAAGCLSVAREIRTLAAAELQRAQRHAQIIVSLAARSREVRP